VVTNRKENAMGKIHYSWSDLSRLEYEDHWGHKNEDFEGARKFANSNGEFCLLDRGSLLRIAQAVEKTAADSHKAEDYIADAFKSSYLKQSWRPTVHEEQQLPEHLSGLKVGDVLWWVEELGKDETDGHWHPGQIIGDNNETVESICTKSVAIYDTKSGHLKAVNLSAYPYQHDHHVHMGVIDGDYWRTPEEALANRLEEDFRYYTGWLQRLVVVKNLLESSRENAKGKREWSLPVPGSEQTEQAGDT